MDEELVWFFNDKILFLNNKSIKLIEKLKNLAEMIEMTTCQVDLQNNGLDRARFMRLMQKTKNESLFLDKFKRNSSIRKNRLTRKRNENSLFV